MENISPVNLQHQTIPCMYLNLNIELFNEKVPKNAKKENREEKWK